MAKRPHVRTKSAPTNATPHNRRRGFIIRSRQGRTKDVAGKLFGGQLPKPKKAGRNSRKKHGASEVTLSEVAIAKLAAETRAAQADVKAKTKKEDSRAFDAEDPTMRDAKYRIVGKKSTTRFAPRVWIAEGHLPHILKQEDSGRFANILELTIEMSVGNAWYVMSHSEFLKQVREQLAVPA